VGVDVIRHPTGLHIEPICIYTVTMTTFHIGMRAVFALVLVLGLYTGLMALLAWFGPERYLEMDRSLLPWWLRISMDGLSDDAVIRRARTTYLIYALLLLGTTLCIGLLFLGPVVGAVLRNAY
jgi:hypothetical protein